MSDSSDHIYDVIVIGAGVEGSATAYYLTSRHTKNVLLLEQVTTLIYVNNQCNDPSYLCISFLLVILVVVLMGAPESLVRPITSHFIPE